MADFSAGDFMGECCNVLKGNTEEYNKKTEELLKLLKEKLDPHIVENTKALKELIAKLGESKQIKGGSRKGGGGGGSKGRVGIGDFGGGGEKAGQILGLDFTKGFKKTFNFQSIATGLSNSMKRPLDTLFKGLVVNELEFMKNMREIGYVTQGITGDFEGLQNAFQEFGEQGRITGVNLDTFQEKYVANLRRGVKTQKEMLSVTKTGLHVSTMVGDKGNEIADTLALWHTRMGLSAGATAQLGRGIQEVSRITGVMGSALANVVKQSEQIVMAMRNWGSLTAIAASNVIGLLASAEKLGVSGAMGEMLKGATSFNALLNETDPKMKTLLIQMAGISGRWEELRSGTFLTGRAGIQSAADSIEQILSQYGINPDTDLSKVDPGIRYAIQRRTGKAVGELLKMRESLLENAKSYATKEDEINKKLDSQNTTVKEHIKLEADLKALQMGRGMQMMSVVQAATDKADSYEEAITKANAAILSDEDIVADLKKAGKAANAQGAMTFSAENLKKAGAGDFLKDVQEAFGTKDLKKIKELEEKMSEAEQKLKITEKKGTDPFGKLEQATIQLNEAIRGLRGVVIALAGILAPLMWMGGIGAQVASYGSGIGKLFGKGGGASKAMGLLGLGGKGATAGGAAAGCAVKAGTQMMLPGMAGGASKGGLKALGGIAGKLAWPLAIITTGLGGLFNGLESAGKATEFFGGKVEDLTASQRTAAESGGFLTGMLNFLTFGIFKGALGPTGSLTKTLAVFFDKFPIFTAIIQTLMIPFKILWATLKGLWQFLKNSFVGLWEGLLEIWKAFEPLREVVVELFTTIADAFGGFGGMGEGFETASGWISKITDVLSWLGKALGWVFKILGKVIGFFVKFFIKPIIWGIKLVIAIIKPAIEYLKIIFGFIGEAVRNIYDLFSGNISFTEFLSKMWNALVNAMKKFGTWLYDNTIGRMKNFGAWLYKNTIGKLKGFGTWLYNNLVEGLKNFGNWLYENTIKQIIDLVPDWMKPKTEEEKAAEVAQKIAATAELESKLSDSRATRESEGASFTRGIGRVFGGVGSQLFSNADDLEAARAQVRGGIGETVVGGLKGAASVMTLGLFDKGSDRITRTGAAVVHRGEAIIPAEGNEYTGRAAAMQNVYDRMRREQSSASSVTQQFFQGKKLEAINQKQADLLAQINTGISTLVSLMRPNETVGANTSTGPGAASHITPARSTDYAKWQFGLQSSSPGVQRINDGQ